MAQANAAAAKGQRAKGSKKKKAKAEEPYQHYKREAPPRLRVK